jgi:hypothetical protein
MGNGLFAGITGQGFVAASAGANDNSQAKKKRHKGNIFSSSIPRRCRDFLRLSDTFDHEQDRRRQFNHPRLR